MARSGEGLAGDCSEEEVYINSYGVFMGYVSMAIKGLGFLVLTWTTVVLLGGFVSMLHKKDFWCLTFITLVQTAGIFDVSMNEKLAYMRNAQGGLSAAIYSAVLNSDVRYIYFWPCVFLAISAVMVQLGLFAVILAPLAIIYVLGIFMSGVISLWRLIEHDYGGNSDGEASNLAPAMDTLYYLALLQGVLFCYRFVLGRLEKKLVYYGADTTEEVLYTYLGETRRGCEKDPSFVQGRNLTTYAVDKIGSNSAADRIYGVKILYEAIRLVKHNSSLDLQRFLMKRPSSDSVDVVTGQRMLMKHLVLCASSSRHVLQQLLEMLDSSGLNNRENRSQAAVIVEQLAPYIHLEQFPRGIQHISSLIGTFEQFSTAEPYHNKRTHDQRPSPAGQLGEAYNYMELFLQGLSILRDLAAEENNCRVMSETRDLVSKIMAPVTFDLLDHTTDLHGTWYKVVDQSMEVLSQLTGAQGETGAKLRREISSCAEAIGTFRRILSCKMCEDERKQKAIWILTRLYMDTLGISGCSTGTGLPKKKSSFCRQDFVRMLVYIFTHGNKYSSSVTACAGEALSEICFHAEISGATVVIQTSGDVVARLTQVLINEENETCKQTAAEILEHICTHYTKDDKYLGKLKKAILEVIGEILCCGDGTHNGKDAFAKPKADIESQCEGTQENNEEVKDEEGLHADALSIMSPKLLSSLLSLCATVYDTMLIIDLPPQLDASSFINKLQESICMKKRDPTVENLSLCKATGKMAISMMKYYSDEFFKQEYFGSLIEELSIVSKNMLDLDYSVVCSSASGSKTRSKLDRRTLMSLAREAEELLASRVPSAYFNGC